MCENETLDILHSFSKCPLPFSSLKRSSDIRFLYGYSADFIDRKVPGAPLPGNYLVGSLMKKLRTSGEVRFHKRDLNVTLMFEVLPVEIILEILLNLHPLDLFHLMQASEGTKIFLLSRKLEWLWKRVYESNNLPACPEDWTFLNWTSLIFGAALCDECGCRRAVCNFFWRRRLCDHCHLQGELFLDYDEVQEYIDTPNDDWNPDLFCYSIYESAVPFPYSESGSAECLFLKSEVARVVTEIQCHQTAIDDGLPYAAEAYQAFKQERAREVEKRMEHALDCTTWGTALTSEIEYDQHLVLVRIVDKAERHLLALGHERRDFSGAVMEVLQEWDVHKLNMRAYYRYLPQIEEEIRRIKALRIAHERNDLVDMREEIVETVYGNIPDSILPPSTKYEPTDKTIQRYGVFYDYINDPSDVFNHEFPEDVALLETQRLMEEWEQDCRRRLVLAARAEDYEQTIYVPNAHLISEENILLVDLATTVFYCPKCDWASPTGHNVTFFGFSDARMHMNCLFNRDLSGDKLLFPKTAGTVVRNFGLSFEGYTTVCSLLKLLDMDPKFTLTRDLDRQDPRFFCMHCYDKCLDDARTIRSLSWKECVLHATEFRHPSTGPAEWGLLSSEATKSMKAIEGLHPSPDKAVWYCLHCSEFRSESQHQRHRAIIEHVLHEHNLDAVFGVDIDFAAEMTSSSRMVYPIKRSANYRCRLCSGERGLRLWELNQLTETHIPHNHPHAMPTEANWEKIHLLERVSESRPRWQLTPVIELGNYNNM